MNIAIQLKLSYRCLVLFVGTAAANICSVSANSRTKPGDRNNGTSFPWWKEATTNIFGDSYCCHYGKEKRGKRVPTWINTAVRGTDAFDAKGNRSQLVFIQHIPAYTAKGVVEWMSHCLKIESVSHCHYWYILRSNLHSCHIKSSRFGPIKKPFTLWTDKVLTKTHLYQVQ